MLARPHPLRSRNRQHTDSLDSDSTVPPYSVLPPAKTVVYSPLLPTPSPPAYSSHPTINPLDIPEILHRVGQFLPLWIYSDQGYKPQFIPETLVRCTRVSRRWYNVMSPILWYLYDDILMGTVPRQVVHRNAHFIKILNHRHVYGGSEYPCRNLSQLSTAPWFTGAEDQIKQNTRLEKFSWNTSCHYQNIRQSIYDSLAGLGAGINNSNTRGLTLLRELEFVGCELDPRQLFPLLENHLPGLRILILRDVAVVSEDRIKADKTSELSNKPWNPQAQFIQIREVRMGRNIIRGGRSLIDILNHCSKLEKLVIEEIEQSWSSNQWIPGNVDLFNHLIYNIQQSCPNLKSIVYSPNEVSSNKNLILLSDTGNANLIRCIDPSTRDRSKTKGDNDIAGNGIVRNGHERVSSKSQHSIRSGASDEEDQDYTIPSFTACMPNLGTSTTLALCNMDTTLVSIALRLYEYRSDITERANMLNAHQILTSCRVLKHFALEHVNISEVFEIITPASTALLLFDNPWACHSLETLVLDGVKRPTDFGLNRDNNSGDSGSIAFGARFRRPVCLTVRLQELLLLAGLGSPEEAPQIASVINMGYREALLKDIDLLQEKLFHQLAKLKNMHQLTWNGDTFRDFSKLTYY
ncbi:hypothetical protein BGZ46_003936 [Entomortierella lignicola]|nr:hypothetical protein BGZ46_003936 [Entomortierella lignicola]